jgi:hypothetical protein
MGQGSARLETLPIGHLRLRALPLMNRRALREPRPTRSSGPAPSSSQKDATECGSNQNHDPWSYLPNLQSKEQC